ncbi:MAG TPA: NAD(P)-dependent oxidoreductase [Xanthobacteraceae bacterium]|nr:NAD(P)-dependent oxidoreductase [Xanthobacteraceae bacterium]
MNVGVAGLGNMGTAIAERLIETGNKVTVWNRSAEKCNPLIALGATAASSAAALAGAADTIITILTDPAAIDAVYGRPNGLLAGDVNGRLFVEMSTVAPHVEMALASKVRAAGATFVECPVGGSTGPARQGKLIGLMGAEPAAAVRAKPLLDRLCRRLEHCGPVGSGATMKLAINLPLMVYWQALGEALALCRHLGLDPGRVIELMSDTSGGPNVLKVRAPALVNLLRGEDPGPATFTLDNGIKDLRTMLAEGARCGVELPLVADTLACFEEASRHGLGTGEGAAMSVYWSTRAANK